MPSKLGTITKWDDEKGFGFITPKRGERSVFVHINDYDKKHQRPRQGLSVIYFLSKDKKGGVCAAKVFPQNVEDEFKPCFHNIESLTQLNPRGGLRSSI